MENPEKSGDGLGITGFERNSILTNILEQQLKHQKEGDYKEAQRLRLKYIGEKQNQEDQQVHNLQTKYGQELYKMRMQHLAEISDFNQFWANKISDFEKESAHSEEELIKKHKEDQNRKKAELEKQFTLKTKESSELLNLRKMEEHLAKQKNYVQASKVQALVMKLEKEENSQWLSNRKNRIQTLISNLRDQQKNEHETFQKRSSTIIQEYNLEKLKGETIINLKHENLLRDFRFKHQKEVLLLRGEIKMKPLPNIPRPSPSKYRD